MLNLIYSKLKAPNSTTVLTDSRYFFSKQKKAEWFKDPFVQRLMEYVDGTTLVDGFVLKNGKGEIIPPEYLPTGTKTAILVYEFPNLIFNATQIGDNAFLFVSALCKKQDRTLLTYRYLPEFLLEGLELQKDGKPFKLEDYDNIVNDWLDEGYDDPL